MSLDFDLHYDIKTRCNTINATSLNEILQFEIKKIVCEELVNVLTKRTFERLRGMIHKDVGRRFKDITLNEYTTPTDFELMKSSLIQEELNQKMPVLSRQLNDIFKEMVHDVKQIESMR
jgi:hypothetical protein